MYVVAWEYDVRAGCEAAFAALYGPEGEWVALFRSYDGYVDTQLLQDVVAPSHYLTIDRWASQAAYEAFLTAAESRYVQIDARGDALTTAERCLGRYETA